MEKIRGGKNNPNYGKDHSGRNNGMYSKAHSEESKNKMRYKAKGRNEGTKWFNDGTKEIRFLVGQEPLDWARGRLKRKSNLTKEGET